MCEFSSVEIKIISFITSHIKTLRFNSMVKSHCNGLLQGDWPTSPLYPKFTISRNDGDLTAAVWVKIKSCTSYSAVTDTGALIKCDYFNQRKRAFFIIIICRFVHFLCCSQQTARRICISHILSRCHQHLTC